MSLRSTSSGWMGEGSSPLTLVTAGSIRSQVTKTGNLLEEAVIAVGLWGEPPRGVCLIYEVTSKGHVLLTYGQVLLKPC